MAKAVPIGARGEVEKRTKFQHTLTAWGEELPPVQSHPGVTLLTDSANNWGQLGY